MSGAAGAGAGTGTKRDSAAATTADREPGTNRLHRFMASLQAADVAVTGNTVDMNTKPGGHVSLWKLRASAFATPKAYETATKRHWSIVKEYSTTSPTACGVWISTNVPAFLTRIESRDVAHPRLFWEHWAAVPLHGVDFTLVNTWAQGGHGDAIAWGDCPERKLKAGPGATGCDPEESACPAYTRADAIEWQKHLGNAIEFVLCGLMWYHLMADPPRVPGVSVSHLDATEAHLYACVMGPGTTAFAEWATLDDGRALELVAKGVQVFYACFEAAIKPFRSCGDLIGMTMDCLCVVLARNGVRVRCWDMQDAVDAAFAECEE